MSDGQPSVELAREIEELVRSGRQGCIALRTLLKGSDGPAGFIGGAEFCADAIEAIFNRIDEALAATARGDGTAPETRRSPD
jgi:hypothetical protein